MPSKLGKYILVRTLGSGANSKVKLAYDPEVDRYYAIKIMNQIKLYGKPIRVNKVGGNILVCFIVYCIVLKLRHVFIRQLRIKRIWT